MKKLTGIKAVSFDADQTLWDFQKVMRHSLGYVMTELERQDPTAASMLSIDKMIEIRNAVAEELKGEVTNLKSIRLEAFKRTLSTVGRHDDSLAAHLNSIYLQHRFEDIELYEDVLPTLTELRKRYGIGLLSNGNSYPDHCGLEGMFKFVVFSQDIGIEKPDPRFYQIAVEQASCSKAELLHVGDSLDNDVIGAANAGIKSVWLNRQHMSPASETKVDYEIQSLAELVEILE